MRTSDLIGVKVYDNGGNEIGKVHDIRAALDGRHDVEAPYVATHLLIAAGSVGTRLGYGYGYMHGPWPLSSLMRRAMHRGYAVRWDQIASLDPDRRLLLNATRDELMTMAELVKDSG